MSKSEKLIIEDLPTVQEWIRTEKNIYIEIYIPTVAVEDSNPVYGITYCYCLYDISGENAKVLYSTEEEFDTPRNALEAGVNYVLSHIVKKL